MKKNNTDSKPYKYEWLFHFVLSRKKMYQYVRIYVKHASLYKKPSMMKNADTNITRNTICKCIISNRGKLLNKGKWQELGSPHISNTCVNPLSSNISQMMIKPVEMKENNKSYLYNSRSKLVLYRNQSLDSRYKTIAWFLWNGKFGL